MAFVSSMEKAPSGPVVKAGAPPPCMTMAPSSGADPSVTIPLTVNTSGRGVPVEPDPVEVSLVVDAEDVVADPPPPADWPPAPPGPSDGGEHAWAAQSNAATHSEASTGCRLIREDYHRMM